MADKYSVIYDPGQQEPFAIIRQSVSSLTAHPVHKSASQWATEYNSGKKQIPYGMTATEFVEMGCDFVQSFKDAFGRGERLQRRVEMISESTKETTKPDIIFGVGPTKTIRRKNGFTRIVMPVVSHMHKDFLRSRLINQAIEAGKKWKRKNQD